MFGRYIYLHHSGYIHHLGLSSFWLTFLAELLAGLLVAGIATALIPWYLERRRLRKSRLFLCFYDRTQEFTLKEISRNYYEGNFRLEIKNSSPYSLRDVYLNMYLPDVFTTDVEIDPPAKYGTPDAEITSGQAPGGYLIACRMTKPIHPGRYFRLPFEIKVKTNRIEFIENSYGYIYYYLSTEMGVFPKAAEFMNEERSVWRSEFDKLAKLILKKPA